MMPFYNIFNEWHSAQTSKKVREVFRVKAAEGKRILSHVPYGYMKSENDSKEWIIDEYTAGVVRHIYDLCLQGYGTTETAKKLQSEHILLLLTQMRCISNSQGVRASGIICLCQD